MATQKPVHIIGLGIAGAVLGRCLQMRGIPTVIFEKNGRSHRYNYSITLQASTYRSLLPVLGIDAKFFRQLCAADKGDSPSKKLDLSSSLRVNRGDFEDVLQEGLEVNWGHALRSIERTPSDSLSLTFENGRQFEGSMVVGTDGVHSRVRQFVAPTNLPDVLPYAVINGKRRLNNSNFALLAHHFDGKDHIQYLHEDVLLHSYVNDNGTNASISYTYSRPSQGKSDDLYRPNRTISGATDIPQRFFDEVRKLVELPDPWNRIFNSDLMLKDRLLHWQMRKSMLTKDEIAAGLASNVALIGDSLHTTPIIGSYGADLAVEDAIKLADVIATGGHLESFYLSNMDRWNYAIKNSEARLAELHKPTEEDSSKSERSQL